MTACEERDDGERREAGGGELGKWIGGAGDREGVQDMEARIQVRIEGLIGHGPPCVQLWFPPLEGYDHFLWVEVWRRLQAAKPKKQNTRSQFKTHSTLTLRQH